MCLFVGGGGGSISEPYQESKHKLLAHYSRHVKSVHAQIFVHEYSF